MKKINDSPIVIGGMGGSGTRVIANILIESGVFLGNDLNRAMDNLVFTRLFKDPMWFRATNKEGIITRLKIFEKYMTRQALSLNDLKETFSAFKKNKIHKTHKRYYLKFILKHFIDKNPSNLWGWKEPNTHIYIKYIAQYFDQLRYIHVIRNGLDMAFTKNQQQLFNWGFLFDINMSKNKMPLYYHQLNYWIKSNKRAIEIAQNILDHQFYLLNYDHFCLNPSIEIAKLMDFLGIEVKKEKTTSLIGLVKLPKSIGRYKDKDLSIFSEAQLKEVEKLGFELSNFNYF